MGRLFLGNGGGECPFGRCCASEEAKFNRESDFVRCQPAAHSRQIVSVFFEPFSSGIQWQSQKEGFIRRIFSPQQVRFDHKAQPELVGYTGNGIVE
jgi:hypothetical protein